uniref:Uncharacterized protein n=1 Tax=Percolomonas cosmopolitus TaxID=63605 RepID=A0A7S1PI10_9EUKA
MTNTERPPSALQVDSVPPSQNESISQSLSIRFESIERNLASLHNIFSEMIGAKMVDAFLKLQKVTSGEWKKYPKQLTCCLCLHTMEWKKNAPIGHFQRNSHIIPNFLLKMWKKCFHTTDYYFELENEQYKKKTEKVTCRAYCASCEQVLSTFEHAVANHDSKRSAQSLFGSANNVRFYDVTHYAPHCGPQNPKHHIIIPGTPNNHRYVIPPYFRTFILSIWYRICTIHQDSTLSKEIVQQLLIAREILRSTRSSDVFCVDMYCMSQSIMPCISEAQQHKVQLKVAHYCSTCWQVIDDSQHLMNIYPFIFIIYPSHYSPSSFSMNNCQNRHPLKITDDETQIDAQTIGVFNMQNFVMSQSFQVKYFRANSHHDKTFAKPGSLVASD